MDITLNWLSVLHDPDDIVEIRSIDPKPVISGYFRAGSQAIALELAKYPERTFYQTLNPIKRSCYARAQHEQLIRNPKETTSDGDILGYQWILVDSDPVRASGVSASDEEKSQAKEVSGRIMKHLKKLGFRDPVIADSGNGYHLLYRIHAEPGAKQIIADFLTTLDMWFSTETVKIDTAVYNQARITKLYGTIARKGADTDERPHRVSRIMYVPEPLSETPMDLVTNTAGECRKTSSPEHTETRRSGASAFDLESFLAASGINVVRKVIISSGTKYELAECPFDRSHKNGDAAVFAYANGSYGFHCFHNSCSGYHWHEFREKLDPSAYSSNAYTMRRPADSVSDRLPANSRPRMLRFGDIPDLDRSKIVVIRSRFGCLDGKIGGFNKGEMSVWSGGNASGKSTLVGQIGLAAVTDGYKVAMFSGEMSAPRVKEWLTLQAAGPEHVEEDRLNPNHYTVKPLAKKKVQEYLADKIAIYDNDFGTSWEDVTGTIYDWIRLNSADVVIIDNLMALDITSVSAEKYDMQSKVVKRFSLMAKQLNVHIHFICHPRKTDAFLRKSDISGTADITNAADNVFMVHRVNADFMARYKSVYPKLNIPADAGNVIEIMKNRDMGVVDEMIMLYFDRTCKLMSDVKGMIPRHGWGEQLTQLKMSGFEVVDDTADLPEEWRK